MEISRIASWMLILTIGIAFLIVAQDFLVPLVLAALIWFVINSIASLIGKVKIAGKALPGKFCNLLAMTILFAGLFGAGQIISGSIDRLITAAPSYESNVQALVQKGMEIFRLKEIPTFQELADQVNLTTLVGDLGAMLSGIASHLFLIVLYLVFMLLEQSTFPLKWRAMFSSSDSMERGAKTLGRVTDSVRKYITYKTGINLVTALLNFVVISLIGLDFPIFWAFLIFLINYIPTIGTLVAVLLPTLFAMIQFETYGPIIAVFVGIAVVQGVMMNIVEPRILGRLLNISGLVVVLSLVLWGTLWGIVGMVLSVPIMVSLIIIMAEYPSTRRIAIWLSEDGNLETKAK